MVIGPNFVYLAIPRTASQTLTHHFLPRFGGELLEPYHRRDVPAEHRHKFTFTVVRNPYDRMISCWHYCRRIPELSSHDIEGIGIAGFARWCMTWANEKRSGFWCQAKMTELVRLDAVVRYEDLESGLRALPFVKGNFEMPAIHNAVSRPPLSEDLTTEAVEAINEHSAADFERFGYEQCPM